MVEGVDMEEATSLAQSTRGGTTPLRGLTTVLAAEVARVSATPTREVTANMVRNADTPTTAPLEEILFEVGMATAMVPETLPRRSTETEGCDHLALLDGDAAFPTLTWV